MIDSKSRQDRGVESLHVESEDRQNFREVKGALEKVESSLYVTGSSLRTREYNDIDFVTESIHSLRGCIELLTGIEDGGSEKTQNYLERVNSQSDILEEVHTTSNESQTPEGYGFSKNALIVKLDYKGTEFDIVYDNGCRPLDDYIEL